MRISPPRSQAGVGLIEIGIAIVVVIVAAVALGRLLTQSTRSAALSEARSEAIALAEGQLESLRSFSTLADYDGIADPGSPLEHSGTNAEFAIEWSVVATSDGPFLNRTSIKRVVTTVSWEDPEGPQSVVLESVIAGQIPVEAGKRLQVLSDWAAAGP